MWTSGLRHRTWLVPLLKIFYSVALNGCNLWGHCNDWGLWLPSGLSSDCSLSTWILRVSVLCLCWWSLSITCPWYLKNSVYHTPLPTHTIIYNLWFPDRSSQVWLRQVRVSVTPADIGRCHFVLEPISTYLLTSWRHEIHIYGGLVDTITVNIGSAHKMVDFFGCLLHIDERKLEGCMPVQVVRACT